MADQQERPDEGPQSTPPPGSPRLDPRASRGPGTESTPPKAPAAESPAAQPPVAEPPAAGSQPLAPPPPPAKKQPAKAAKKTPAKKTPAKAAKKAAKKAAAKKAAAKKTPAAPKLADTNGDLTSAAKEAAAKAKATVASANNPAFGPAPVPLIGPEPSRLPIVAAIAAGVLAILVVLLARRGSGDS
ncbi:MAG TPA: hypothetical protein VGA66_18500 [Mycobacterium sp.]